MIEKLYQFAALEFALSLPEDRMYDGDYWLAPFQARQVKNPHRYTFRWVDTLPNPQGVCISKHRGTWTFEQEGKITRCLGVREDSLETANMCIVHRGMDHEVWLSSRVFQGRTNASIVLDALDVNYLILQNNGIILHSSYIERDGKAVLFTAPCQTGKSTQAQLWKDFRNADIINGDRAVIRIQAGEILAEGLPYCGTSNHSKNRSIPLEAIVYLGQAPVTTIRRLRGYEAFSRIWEGIAVDRGNKAELEKASETVQAIVGQIPIYHMPCTPDEDAVAVLEQTLRKQANL